MLAIDRRNFLRSSAAASLSVVVPADLIAQAATSAVPASRWDAGALRNVLPTVSDWYPDVLGSDGKLTVNEAKPYWQSGWLRQHDRLMEAISTMKGRSPLVISGDLHAIGIGRMLRSGKLDLKANPITTVLAGPIGSRTTPLGWPSGRRGTGAMPPAHLDMVEEVKPIEQHGFTLVDFTPDKIVLRFFKWDWKTEAVDKIDTLQPFHVAELVRPA